MGRREGLSFKKFTIINKIILGVLISFIFIIQVYMHVQGRLFCNQKTMNQMYGFEGEVKDKYLMN